MSTPNINLGHQWGVARFHERDWNEFRCLKEEGYSNGLCDPEFSGIVCTAATELEADIAAAGGASEYERDGFVIRVVPLESRDNYEQLEV